MLHRPPKTKEVIAPLWPGSWADTWSDIHSATTSYDPGVAVISRGVEWKVADTFVISWARRKKLASRKTRRRSSGRDVVLLLEPAGRPVLTWAKMRTTNAYGDTGRIRSGRGPVLAVLLGRGELKGSPHLMGPQRRRRTQSGQSGAWDPGRHGRLDCAFRHEAPALPFTTARQITYAYCGAILGNLKSWSTTQQTPEAPRRDKLENGSLRSE